VSTLRGLTMRHALVECDGYGAHRRGLNTGRDLLSILTESVENTQKAIEILRSRVCSIKCEQYQSGDKQVFKTKRTQFRMSTHKVSRLSIKFSVDITLR
jgi:hypothetical protein